VMGAPFVMRGYDETRISAEFTDFHGLLKV